MKEATRHGMRAVMAVAAGTGLMFCIAARPAGININDWRIGLPA